jgi:tetratricopeptide (TPR) repeat protein
MGEQSQQFHDALNEGARFLSQNRPGEALRRLEPLYAQAPDHPDVAINISGAYILQRKWNKAVDVLVKAVRAHPDNAMLWTNMGAAQLGRLELSGPQQQEKAMHAYYQALRADPQTPNVHYHLGLIYKERRELTRATAMFQRAVEVNPADNDARYWLKRLTVAGLEEEDRKPEADSPADMDAGAGYDETHRKNGS